jgi:uncharacterized membrane protein
VERELAPLHPIVVHFAIAFLVGGVLFRLLWLIGGLLGTKRLSFAGTNASTFLLLGTLAAFVAVKSGEAARGGADGVPGAQAMVRKHEEWAGWTLRVFLGVAALELIGLLRARSGRELLPLAASGILGLPGLYLVFHTGDHGGTVVYSHAGGVGMRTGDPQDVGRLLLAGLYQQSVLDRSEGRPEEAARLIETAAARFPNDTEVQLLLAESQMEDRKDPSIALATLERTPIRKEEAGLRLRHGILRVDALLAAGRREEALAALRALRVEFPEEGLVKARVQSLDPATSSPSAATSSAPPR